MSNHKLLKRLQAAIDREEPHEIIVAADNFLAVDSHHVDALHAKVSALLTEGDGEAASEVIESAEMTRILPFEYAYSLYQSKRDNEALSFISSVSKMDEGLYHVKAQALYRLGRYSQAADVYETLLAQGADVDTVTNALAALYQAKKSDEALKMVNETGVDESTPEYDYNKALLFLDDGEVDTTLELISDIVDEFGGVSQDRVKLLLGCAYGVKGMADEAAAFLEPLVGEAGSKNEDIQRASVLLMLNADGQRAVAMATQLPEVALPDDVVSGADLAKVSSQDLPAAVSPDEDVVAKKKLRGKRRRRRKKKTTPTDGTIITDPLRWMPKWERKQLGRRRGRDTTSGRTGIGHQGGDIDDKLDMAAKASAKSEASSSSMGKSRPQKHVNRRAGRKPGRRRRR